MTDYRKIMEEVMCNATIANAGMYNPRADEIAKLLDPVTGTGKPFTKYDTGKPRWSLVPWKEFTDVVTILTAGAKEYGDYNWQKCKDTTRYSDATLRHLTSWLSGDKIDKESGKSHLAHVICNCLFLMWMSNNKDTREQFMKE